MALGKYGPAGYNFRPVDADVYDTRGAVKVPTFINSTGTAGLPKIDSAGRVEFWVEAGDYHLLLTTPDGDTVTESVQIAPGGTDDPTDPNAASSAMSATRLAQVTLAGTPFTLAPGNNYDLDWTGATIVKGAAALWRGPDSALDLDVSIFSGGSGVVPPVEDCQYDIQMALQGTGGLADAERLVGVGLVGNLNGGWSYAPVLAGDGAVHVTNQGTDQWIAGDIASGSYIGMKVTTSHLTADLTVTAAHMLLIKR